MSDMEHKIKDELLYTEEHEWAKLENSKAVCGITDYAQKTLADIVYVELPNVGREVSRGEAVATVESVKAAADVYSPFSGKIVDVNEKLKDDPAILNKDPYGEGWIFKVEIENKEESVELMSPEEYREYIESIER